MKFSKRKPSLSWVSIFYRVKSLSLSCLTIYFPNIKKNYINFLEEFVLRENFIKEGFALFNTSLLIIVVESDVFWGGGTMVTKMVINTHRWPQWQSKWWWVVVWVVLEWVWSGCLQTCGCKSQRWRQSGG